MAKCCWRREEFDLEKMFTVAKSIVEGEKGIPLTSRSRSSDGNVRLVDGMPDGLHDLLVLLGVDADNLGHGEHLIFECPVAGCGEKMKINLNTPRGIHPAFPRQPAISD